MISFAAHLKRQSPSMAYGNGWIMGQNGKRWHPCANQPVSLSCLPAKRTGLIARIRKVIGG